jgi:photosystem II stability/assembly factor-like uncharacterized protein
VRVTGSGTSPYVMAMGVSSFGTGGPRVGWAINGLGIFVTTDGGRQWRNVTPPLLRDQVPGDRAERLTVLGTEDLWLPVHDVIGLVSPAQAEATGSDRAQGIFRSSDGGRTWAFSALPGCLQSCGAGIRLSFVNPHDGFALLEPTNAPLLRLYVTTDGGATWRLVSEPPFHGDNADIAFATARDGWAATAPTYGRYADPGHARVSDPGGAVYRTTDGGRTWSRATGLPRYERLQVPVLIGKRTAIVLGQDPRPDEHGRATVYVSENDGDTWQPHRAPGDANLVRYLHHDLAAEAPPFSVASARRWSMFVGPELFRTDDAGARWMAIRTDPRWSPGAVLSLDLGSRRRGWAEAYVPNCEPMTGVGPCTPVSPPLLESTTDGGANWHAVDYWRPPPNF